MTWQRVIVHVAHARLYGISAVGGRHRCCRLTCCPERADGEQVALAVRLSGLPPRSDDFLAVQHPEWAPMSDAWLPGTQRTSACKLDTVGEKWVLVASTGQEGAQVQSRQAGENRSRLQPLRARAPGGRAWGRPEPLAWT